MSALVMSLTGYSWAAMQGLVTGLTTADVIDAGGDYTDGARDILLVGMDSRTDAQGNPLSEEMLAKLHAGFADGELNTDTLIFVRIPEDGDQALAISLPRDSYVPIPGHGTHKINSAYARSKLAAQQRLQAEGVQDPQELEKRSDQEGARTLIATVEQLTGVAIDNYASINLLGFHDITKAIGGVEVCLNQPVNDPYSGAQFDAGRQTISGAEALAFVRQRHGLPNGDLDRVIRQQVFLAGLANKVLSAGTLTDPGKLNSLVDAIQKAVVVDQDWDILNFAQQMQNLTGGNVAFRTAPILNAAHPTPNDGAVVQLDTDGLRELAGSLPDESETQEQDQPHSQNQTSEAGPKPQDITVDVYNSSGIDGLAGRTSRTLVEQGFLPGDVAGGPPRDTSVIRVPAGERDAGHAVAQAIGGTIGVEENPGTAAGHVEVLLAADPSAGENADSPQQAGQSQASSVNSSPPIKADGVTCVN